MSALLSETWVAPDGTRVRLAIPDGEMLESVEDAWPSGRFGTATAHWDWRRIAAMTKDCFAVLAQDEIIALWAGQPRLRSIAGHACYRVEFLEVSPARRGAGIWGVLAMILIALRADELGADGLAFGALPSVAAWYQRLGAQTVPKYAWKGPPGTVKLCIVESAFDALVEAGRG